MRTQEIVEAYGKTHIYMIGMDDNPQPKHIEVIIKNVKHDNIFSGGKRHYEIVKPFLPADAVWIEIKAPINAVLTEYSRLIQEGKVIVSFVSGDPFFFGFASTIRKNLLGVGMKVFPYFNSLQMFAHHEQIPYENMHAVSVTGRPWHELDRALLEYRPLIGVLTDRIHTPRAIAKRMMEYHLDRDYTMWVAEHLGNPKKEKIYKIYSIEEISEMSFTNPNCVLLMKASLFEPVFQFIHLIQLKCDHALFLILIISHGCYMITASLDGILLEIIIHTARKFDINGLRHIIIFNFYICF